MQDQHRGSSGNKVRFGFLSTAQIGQKNWKAIAHSGNSIVTAVASRDVERSRQFIANCQRLAPFEKPPAALGSYEELIAAKDVDALYIPLPTGLRKEWVIRAAEAGKHVVCEKPCALSAADLREMIAACRKNRVQFMDGVMFMHHPRLERIRRVIDDGTSVGRIKRVMSIFSFRGGENFLRTNIRVHSDLEPAGCLGDLGWYCIRFILWALHWQLPREVTGRVLSACEVGRSPLAVPLDFSAELVFGDDVSAGFYSSFLAQMQQWANVSGTKGYLRVSDFVFTQSDLESAFEVNNNLVRVKAAADGQANGDAVAQQTNLFRTFSNHALSGRLDAFWPEIALKTQQVMDACLESARAGGRAVVLRQG